MSTWRLDARRRSLSRILVLSISRSLPVSGVRRGVGVAREANGEVGRAEMGRARDAPVSGLETPPRPSEP